MRDTSFAEFPIHALMEITARPDLVFVEGHGSWLIDHPGKWYLVCASRISSSSAWPATPPVSRRIRRTQSPVRPGLPAASPSATV
jgi:acetylornithine/succinyldiaminopimelate/putrescine aminotransferase